MTTAICIGYTFFVFVCGIAFGATVVRDWIDMPSRRKPRTAVPLARVLSRAEEKRLELPTAKRRQAIRTALGWGRVIDVDATEIPRG